MTMSRDPLAAAVAQIGILRGLQTSLTIDALGRFAKYDGADKKLLRLAQVRSTGQLGDLLAEVRWALAFDGLGFAVQVEPRGTTGPDFAVRRDPVEFSVEVSRFIPNHPGPPLLGSADVELAEYGDLARDADRVLAKVIDKISQLAGDYAVIALWSDDESVEDVDTDLAVRDLRANRLAYRIPPTLRYVLFASDSIRLRDGGQYRAFSLEADATGEQWAHELEATTEHELIEAALRRL